jgi:hypothetical protein
MISLLSLITISEFNSSYYLTLIQKIEQSLRHRDIIQFRVSHHKS